ncbi:MAG: septal ring lytic transglycosylase RlpA family protein [Spirochaetaceae bacterium]|nr:septal ring lytic transglycosylase RlpA family protein [Spirochaetaceae bacterium]
MKRLLVITLAGLVSLVPVMSQEAVDGMGSCYYGVDAPGLFASHASYPFGTQVRITNLENQRQLVVQVGGRIPQDRRWIIDVSVEAAEALGMSDAGFTRVRVEEIPKENKPRVLRSAGNIRRFFQSGQAELWAEGSNLTAGHPSLPVGTKLRVTNRDTGQRIEVTIATRVRAAQNRILTLTQAAGGQIGVRFDRSGLSQGDITIESLD